MEYSDSESSHPRGILVLCRHCQDQIADNDWPDEGVHDLIHHGLALPTDDPCDHCGCGGS